MIQRETLFVVLDALDTVGIQYMIVGSYASNYWGRPRSTHDADLIVEIAPKDATVFARLLEGEFYVADFAIRKAALERGHFNAIHLQEPFKVDFWVRKEEPYDLARFRRRREGTIFGRRVWITSAEDVILSKLSWYRISPLLPQQLRDALEVYEIQERDLDHQYLQRWASRLGVDDLLEHIRQEAAIPPE